MKVINYPLTIAEQESAFSKWARISFFIYLFFVIFGTMLPFQDSLQQRGEMGDMPTTNLVNQLLSLLYLVSFVSLWGQHTKIIAFIKREKFLTLFLLWTFASIFWSSYTSVSLRRWISLFGEYIICLAALMHFKWSDVGLRSLRVLWMIYLPLTIISVIFIPEAVQWEFPAWRGLAPTKNNLGQVALFSIIMWLAIISYHKKRSINFLHYLMLGLAIVSFLGARSTTSFLVGSFLLFVAGILFFGKRLGGGRIASLYALFTVVAVASVIALTTIYLPVLISQFLGIFGKDLTFTGRIDLWETVYAMTEDKIFHGWGIGGFWVSDGDHLVSIYREYVWLPNQAHQGYLDILNQTGIVGLSLVLLMIVRYLVDAQKLRKKDVWKWLFIGIVIYNFQESLFFRPRHIGHFFFIFSYMALYSDLLKEQKILRSQ